MWSAPAEVLADLFPSTDPPAPLVSVAELLAYYEERDRQAAARDFFHFGPESTPRPVEEGNSHR